MRIIIASFLIVLVTFDGYCQTNITSVYRTSIDSNGVKSKYVSMFSTESITTDSTWFFNKDGDTTSFYYTIQGNNEEDSIEIFRYSDFDIFVTRFFYNNKRIVFQVENCINCEDNSFDSSTFYYNATNQIIRKYSNNNGWIHIDSTFYNDSLISKVHKYVNYEFSFIETYYHNEKGQLVKIELHDRRGKLRRQIIYDYDDSGSVIYYRKNQYDDVTLDYFEEITTYKKRSRIKKQFVNTENEKSETTTYYDRKKRISKRLSISKTNHIKNIDKYQYTNR